MIRILSDIYHKTVDLDNNWLLNHSNLYVQNPGMSDSGGCQWDMLLIMRRIWIYTTWLKVQKTNNLTDSIVVNTQGKVYCGENVRELVDLSSWNPPGGGSLQVTRFLSLALNGIWKNDIFLSGVVIPIDLIVHTDNNNVIRWYFIFLH